VTDLYTTNTSQIVMYTTQYCSDCIRAKTFFEANQVDYLQVSLEGDEEATEFVISMNNGSRRVPTIIFPDGSFLVEPSWTELREKIAIQ